MAYADILKDLGLSPNEARIYEALLELGESSITEIATRTNIHRRNVYDAVNRLVDKGIITPVIGDKESRYTPVEPSKFLEMVEEKRTKLEEILPAMQKLFAEKKTTEGVFIYKGIEGFKNISRDILRTKGYIYTIGGKRMWLDPLPYSDPMIENWLRAMKKRGIKNLSLLDATTREYYKSSPRISNSEYRFLPPEYSSPTAVDIYNDRVVIYTGDLEKLNENMTTFLIVSKALAESYRQWFKFMWDRCKPIAASPRKKV